ASKRSTAGHSRKPKRWPARRSWSVICWECGISQQVSGTCLLEASSSTPRKQVPLTTRSLLQRLQPDIAKAHVRPAGFVLVILKQNRTGLAKLLVDFARRVLVELAIVNYGDSVQFDGQPSLLGHLAFVVHARRVESDVIRVPLLRRLDGLLLGFRIGS